MKRTFKAGVCMVAATVALSVASGPVTAADHVTRPWVEHGAYSLGPAPDYVFIEGSFFDAHLGKVYDDGTSVTAPSGDKIFYAASGPSLAPGPDFPKCKKGYEPGWAQVYVFTGGTGRFTNAGGRTTSYNCVSERPDGGLDVVYTSRGTLSY